VLRADIRRTYDLIRPQRGAVVRKDIPDREVVACAPGFRILGCQDPDRAGSAWEEEPPEARS
jgi:hypothetical protein